MKEWNIVQRIQCFCALKTLLAHWDLFHSIGIHSLWLLVSGQTGLSVTVMSVTGEGCASSRFSLSQCPQPGHWQIQSQILARHILKTRSINAEEDRKQCEPGHEGGFCNTLPLSPGTVVGLKSYKWVYLNRDTTRKQSVKGDTTSMYSEVAFWNLTWFIII